VEWFKKAADQGHPEALYNYGLHHHCELYLPRDDEKALHYLKLAHRAGSTMALPMIKIIQTDKLNVLQNYLRASQPMSGEEVESSIEELSTSGSERKKKNNNKKNRKKNKKKTTTNVATTTPLDQKRAAAEESQDFDTVGNDGNDVDVDDSENINRKFYRDGPEVVREGDDGLIDIGDM
jgi:hypothetical protein